VGIGIVLRLRLYHLNRSLWLDELFLVNNFTSRSYLELVGPLEYNQSAGLFFLWLTKSVNHLIGYGEYAFRLAPLLFSIAALILTVFLANRCLGKIGSILAVALMAFSPVQIRYAAELKQYSCEAFFGVLILLLAIRIIQEGPRSGDYLLLLIAGAFGIWFATPLVFCLGGAGIVLIIHLIGQGPNQVGARNRGAVATTDGSHNAISIDGLNAARGRFFPHAPVSHPIFWMTAICLAWFLSFAGHYLVQLRHLQGYDSLFEYWLKYGGFPKGDPFVSLEWWFWPFHAFFKLMLRLVGIHGIYNEVLLGTWMALASFVMGVFILMRRKAWVFMILLAPVSLNMIAAYFHKYPFYGRVMLYASPCLIVPIAAFLEYLIDRVVRSASLFLKIGLSALFLFMAFAIAFPVMVVDSKRFQEGFPIEETRDIMAYLSRGYRTGDQVYLSSRMSVAWKYYAPRFGLDRVHPMVGINIRKDYYLYEEEAREKIMGHSRIWILMARLHSIDRSEKHAKFIDSIEKLGGRLLDKHGSRKAYVYLFDTQE